MMYLSRLRLSRSPSVAALSALLSPSASGERMSAHHRLLWAAFADGPDRRRDFLWRAEGEGEFLTLSARPPNEIDLFLRHEVKPFAPQLRAGDRLSFLLRANATRMKPGGQRVDVVMDALHAIPAGQRAAVRAETAQTEGAAWMARQGASGGFRLIGAEVGSYTTEALPTHSGKRSGQPQFGILDMSGTIEVTDPAVVVSCLAQGFGRAKSYGCGLMLIRRAS